MKRLAGALVPALCLATLLAFGCGGKSATDPAPQQSSTGRVPKEHRVSGPTCPADRGRVRPTADGCTEDAGGVTLCVQDSDCTQGKNGRCLGRGCANDCYYDECLNDSDCAGNVPCLCRASATDPSSNFCDTESNCRVDSDCGPGGFCSPSLLTSACSCVSVAFCDGSCGPNCACGDSCGHGYFCHTTRDSCVEDSDCGDGGSEGPHCAFDRVEKRFSCQGCLVRP